MFQSNVAWLTKHITIDSQLEPSPHIILPLAQEETLKKIQNTSDNESVSESVKKNKEI